MGPSFRGDGEFTEKLSFLFNMDVILLLGTAAMLLIMVWRPHISILSMSAILR